METLVAAILESEKLNSSHAPLSLSRCEMLNLIEEVVQLHPCRNRIKTSMSPIGLDVDQLRLKLLIKNLLDNACHYSIDEQALIDVSLRHTQENVTIEVRDRGTGIAAEDIPRLTEAFYRPDHARQRNTGGYGLGLYLCKLIAEAHGGQIVIESEPGTGTSVTVKLPLDNS
jgi:signal transduction histidine kinase